MKNNLFPLILALLLPACGQSSNRSDVAGDEKIRKQVISIAENYAAGQLKDPKKEIDKYGIITMGDERKRFIIDPSKIYTGLIDSDSEKDAIISVFPFHGQYEVMTEHLILIKKEGKLMLIRAMESDMKIISIKDRVITADVPEHSRNNPLFNCSSCWDVVKYQFKEGELVEIK